MNREKEITRYQKGEEESRTEKTIIKREEENTRK